MKKRLLYIIRQSLITLAIISLSIGNSFYPFNAAAAPDDPASEPNTEESQDEEDDKANTENNSKFTPQVNGYNSTQFKASNKSEFFDACEGGSGSSSSDSGSGEKGDLKKVYVLGDSITLAAKEMYEESFKEAGAEDVRVSASGGGNLERAGSNGTQKSGLDAIDSDKDFIKEATTIIIAHGTNQMKDADASNPDYVNGQKEVIKTTMEKIKDTGTKGKVSWVDVAITESATSNVTVYAGPINQAIYEAKSEGYSVIPWSKQVDSSYDASKATGPTKHNEELMQSDGIHPNTAGLTKLVETVVDGAKNGVATDKQAGESSGCCASGSTVQLAGKDNTEKVLNFFMSKGLTLAQASGAVGNMMQESGVRPDIIQGGATADENYQMQNGVGFGLIQWTFTARQAPLKAKAESMKKKIIDIEVQLEFIWDELNSEYKHTLDAVKATDNPVDAAVAFHGPPSPGYEASADTPGFVRSVRGGNAQKVHDKYKGMTPSGSTSESSSDCGGGSGKVNAEGFAFPADLEKDKIIGFPCARKDFCGHHDGSPAFDLYYKDSNDAENKAVFAIRNGKIENKGNRNGLSHCFDWQVVGDDGYWYWYGHSHKPEKENGESVKAGEKIGEIGPTECADNTPPHLHIDRGIPKGSSGGILGSRDKDFVPIMQKLWEELN